MRRVRTDLRRTAGRSTTRRDDPNSLEDSDSGNSSLFRGGVETTCFYCQEEFDLGGKVVLLREGRIGFGDRTGNVTYVLEDLEELAFHPSCVGPYVSPEEEELLRDIIRTEVEVDTGTAFSEAMAYYDNLSDYEEEQEPQAPAPRTRRERR